MTKQQHARVSTTTVKQTRGLTLESRHGQSIPKHLPLGRTVPTLSPKQAQSLPLLEERGQMAFVVGLLPGLFFPLEMSFWGNGSLQLSPALLLS